MPLDGGARIEVPLTIVAADGFPLAAALTRPPARARGVLVINSAMGVPHRIYAPFARFMAQQGIASLRYDNRGNCGSAPTSLRGFEGSLLCALLCRRIRIKGSPKLLVAFGKCFPS